MTDNNTTFEDAIVQLMELAHKEENSINNDEELSDSDKQTILSMLSGYKKALQDILSVCSPTDDGEL